MHDICGRMVNFLEDKRNLSLKKVFSSLETTYKDDNDALDIIKNARKTAAFFHKRGEHQKAISHIRQLEAFLNDWY